MTTIAKRFTVVLTALVLMTGFAFADTYSENFDTADNWAGGTMTGYNAKTYTNSSVPSNDGFSTNSAVRETSSTNSAGYAFRVDDGAGYYLRYEIEADVDSFSVYMARWDNSPKPTVYVRYSTNSGTGYTNIDTIDGDWFSGDKTYKQYGHTFSSAISPVSGNKIYIEFYTSTGERMLYDDFAVDYTVSSSTDPEPTNHVTSFAATSDHESVSLTWSDNDGAQAAARFLIKASSTSLGAISDPVDGTEPSEDTNLSDGSAAVFVNHGVEAYEFSGLNDETTYYFKIYPCTNSNADIDYKTDGTIPNATQATTATPAAPTLIISEVADPGDDYNGRFVELFNTSNTTIDFSSTTVYFVRQSNGGSESSIQLSGTLAGQTTLVIGNATNIDILYGASTCDLDFGSVTGNGDDGYFLYMNGDEDSGILFDAYGVVDVDGSGEDWEYEDSRAVRKSSVNEPNATWTSSEWTITAADVADMNPGTHAIDSPLPITLTSFTAEAKNGVVELAWETASEVNNARFVIYRNDEAIASVEGAGTTSEPSNYSYIDAEVVPGVAYTYVLADVDYANTETKYDDDAVTVTLGNDIMEADFTVGAAYPNPFNPIAIVPFELSKDAMVQASVYDLVGREVKALVNGNFSAGTHELTIDGNNMTTGIYLVKVTVDNVANIQKIALMK